MDKMLILNLLIVLVVICAMIFLWRIGKKFAVRQFLLKLVLQAESKFGGGNGDVKYRHVVAQFYDKLPTIITCLYTPEEIGNIIDSLVTSLKLNLSSRKIE